MEHNTEYIKLNDDYLRKLQLEMLTLLIEVDRLCREHNIQYFLSYGTLIGAVRHKGFIPWDDDIDIEMCREDYEKFCSICENELDTSKFFLQNQQTDKNYNWVYGKLKLQNTSFIRSGQEHLKQKDGIFIDIFPLDNISSNRFRQKVSLKACKICRRLLWASVGRKMVRNKFSRAAYTALSCIPKKVVTSIFDVFAKSDKKTPYLAAHNYFSGYIFKREWFSEAVTVEFEGHRFYAPIGYHEILSSIYGDYMQLPPVKQRYGHTYVSYIRFLDGLELKVIR